MGDFGDDDLNWRWNDRLNVLISTAELLGTIDPLPVMDQLTRLLPQETRERIINLSRVSRTTANRELTYQVRNRDNWYPSLVEALYNAGGNYNGLVDSMCEDDRGLLVPEDLWNRIRRATDRTPDVDQSLRASRSVPAHNSSEQQTKDAPRSVQANDSADRQTTAAMRPLPADSSSEQQRLVAVGPLSANNSSGQQIMGASRPVPANESPELQTSPGMKQVEHEQAVALEKHRPQPQPRVVGRIPSQPDVVSGLGREFADDGGSEKGDEEKFFPDEDNQGDQRRHPAPRVEEAAEDPVDQYKRQDAGHRAAVDNGKVVKSNPSPVDNTTPRGEGGFSRPGIPSNSQAGVPTNSIGQGDRVALQIVNQYEGQDAGRHAAVDNGEDAESNPSPVDNTPLREGGGFNRPGIPSSSQAGNPTNSICQGDGVAQQRDTDDGAVGGDGSGSRYYSEADTLQKEILKDLGLVNSAGKRNQEKLSELEQLPEPSSTTNEYGPLRSRDFSLHSQRTGLYEGHPETSSNIAPLEISKTSTDGNHTTASVVEEENGIRENRDAGGQEPGESPSTPEENHPEHGGESKEEISDDGTGEIQGNSVTITTEGNTDRGCENENPTGGRIGETQAQGTCDEQGRSGRVGDIDQSPVDEDGSVDVVAGQADSDNLPSRMFSALGQFFSFVNDNSYFS